MRAAFVADDAQHRELASRKLARQRRQSKAPRGPARLPWKHFARPIGGQINVDYANGVASRARGGTQGLGAGLTACANADSVMAITAGPLPGELLHPRN
jgi:hypothetical protein